MLPAGCVAVLSRRKDAGKVEKMRREMVAMTDMWLLDETRIKMHLVDKVSLAAALSGAMLLTVASMLAPIGGRAPSASWVAFAMHTNAASYYDPNSIAEDGGVISVRILMDFNSQQQIYAYSFRSLIVNSKLNCSEKTYSFVSKAYYPENMGSGDVLMRDDAPTPYAQIPSFLAPLINGYCR